MKRFVLSLFVFALLQGICAQECPVYTLNLYDQLPEESNGYKRADEITGSNGCIYKISEPRMDVYLPSNIEKPLGLLLVVPGGAYEYVTADGEGAKVADFLVPKGFAVSILKYRMPIGHENVPLSDALQAMRILRKYRAIWQIPEVPIGVMGFSAGGHLAASLLTHFTDSVTRPDYGILIYPVISMDPSLTHLGSCQNLLGPNPTDEQRLKWSCDKQVTPNTPPCLIVSSEDDRVVPIQNTLNFNKALKDNGVPSSCLIVATGGHGWGFSGYLEERDRVSETILSFLFSQNKSNALRVGIIAHRGHWNCAEGGYARNSIAALRAAQMAGFYGSECDINITSDSVLIVYHDNYIQGLKIDENPYAAFADERLENKEPIPTLDAYLTQTEQSDKTKLVLELKQQSTPELEDEAIRRIILLLQKHNLLTKERVMFISFSLRACIEFAKQCPDLDVQYLGSDLYPSQVLENGINGIDLDYKTYLSNYRFRHEAHKLGMSINVWTVNNRIDIEQLVHAGIDFLTTDNPLLARDILGENEVRK